MYILNTVVILVTNSRKLDYKYQSIFTQILSVLIDTNNLGMVQTSRVIDNFVSI
jgi:hypothetical protein